MSESYTLAREIGTVEWEGKGGLHSEGRQLPRGQGVQAKRTSAREIEGSMSE